MIHYDIIPRSLIGSLLLAATSKGLAAVVVGKGSESSRFRDLEPLFPDHELKLDRSKLSPYRKEFEAYLAGSKEQFSLPLDYSAVSSPFHKKVLLHCRKIPFGRVASYGELAKRVGSPNGARAVGNALGANPLPIVVPCHRVVTSNGDLGGYSGGLQIKKKLLSHEGISTHRSNLRALLKDSTRRR
ncbi:MAG: methylated-DNA--[protein]-cysteine S-methyltransferase [Candidatus Latescibacteria bacterium]|nr:methylated-DNA--[protein]-cysteine S-methyltransferase [Candidatus Latescibacterota bacterium]NIM66369.1 methylated-DNA--[protein]-cysteine S-methyltransferase [Candidatus Latescibacterota bacterium]NIO02848.1 methylated-DNA--[protein]-cysteine S-methyltransferase [Candidatus Latescibacterota bacterium]NIO29983.1 methylated-DNA--[protein]-cysteine S-methyltransferase [Candidatus Latescibacterota bacterium]NIO57598.1 methylated-DNA--[protein]-cysteine S-methyltransferase [Candidatus Latesciba